MVQPLIHLTLGWLSTLILLPMFDYLCSIYMFTGIRLQSCTVLYSRPFKMFVKEIYLASKIKKLLRGHIWRPCFFFHSEGHLMKVTAVLYPTWQGSHPMRKDTYSSATWAPHLQKQAATIVGSWFYLLESQYGLQICIHF